MVDGQLENRVFKMKCSYYGCNQPQIEDSTSDAMKFCQKHKDEFDKAADDGDVRKILSFWIKSNGGAKKLAENF